MNDDRLSPLPAPRSWLDRLGQVLLGEPRDREDLIELLHDAQHRDLLDQDALAMIEGVLQVSELRVRDIMVPRTQMVVVPRDAGLDQLLPVIVEAGHSRYPVVGEDRDEIAGILLAKDLLGYFLPGRKEVFHVRDVLRPAAFIPESKRLNVLLKEFRARRHHMAIVVDEYGGIAGLVTIEDVLEQIVGDIADEHDIDEDALIKRHSDNNFIVKALTPVEDFNRHFGSDFSDAEFDTIGGVLAHGFGRVPRRGESLELGGLRFKVLHADSRRTHLLQVAPLTAVGGEGVAGEVGGH